MTALCMTSVRHVPTQCCSSGRSASRSFPSVRFASDERERFITDWRLVQSRFVDDPQGAVSEADLLVDKVMQARGYPMS